MAEKMADKDDYFNKPMDNDSEKGFKVFLYNKNSGQFCGRTCSSWCKITVFYIIFYLCLSAFWTIMLIIFYQTLDTQRPKWELEGSRIGTVPGLGFRPTPPDENIDSTLIWFKHGGHDTKKNHWIDSLEKFLKPYYEQDKNKDDEHHGICTEDDTSDKKANKVCRFPLSAIKEPCTRNKSFGYDVGHPCVLIKLNRIFNWVPEPYEAGKFPPKMPVNITSVYDYKSVYIWCEGENAADQENMGVVNYLPTNTIANYYFPFTNQPHYVSPFVFVHFTKPKPGILINIECKAWAKNIEHDRMERKGSVHIELLVD